MRTAEEIWRELAAPLPSFDALVKSYEFRQPGHDVSDEPRDESGKWTEGGDGGGGGADTRGDWSHEKEPGLKKEGMNSNSIREAAARAAFEFKLGKVRSGYGAETQEVHVKPNDVPAHWEMAERGSGARSYFDPKLAEKYDQIEGKPEWGQSVKPRDIGIGHFEVKSEPGHIYRGMSYEEYQNALRDGYFESKGGFNLGEAQQGLTYFSTDPTQAQSYANGFAPWMYKATPSRPAVIVEVKDPGNHVDVPGLGRTTTEVGIRGKVPTSSITRAWLGKPHIVDEGSFDVVRDKYRGTSIGGGASYSASVHWEEEKPKVSKRFSWRPRDLHIVARQPGHDVSDEPRDEQGRWTDGGGGGETGGGAISGFSAGVKARNDNGKVNAVKADWFKASPFKGDIENAMKASHVTQAKLGEVGKTIGTKLGIEFKNPGVKTDKARILEKEKIRGGAEAVTDLARGGFLVTSPDQAHAIATELSKHFEVAEEPWKVTEMGYADKAVQIRDTNGLVAEVQILEPKMAEAKAAGHALYAEQRQLDPVKDKVRYDELGAAQRELYGKVTGGYSSEWREALGLSAKKQLSAGQGARRRSA
jgi:hypothetical protein